jgi:metal-responsive CopG/Arc/MetJ family transcriptional regulator
MADTENNKVWINTLVEKELVEEFDQVVKDLDTDRAKLIRNLMRDAVNIHKRAEKVRSRVLGNRAVR